MLDLDETRAELVSCIVASHGILAMQPQSEQLGGWTIMSDRPPEGAAHVAETVGRLRSVQEDFADEPAEVRQQHLREELDRAVSKLVPDRRTQFIRDVLDRFPDWQGSQSNGQAPAAVATAPTSEPEELVEQLIAASGKLSEQERETLSNRLAAAGFATSLKSGETTDISVRLKLPSNTTIASERVSEVLLQLLSAADKIDDMAWKAWRLLDRQSSRRKPGDFRAMMIAYLTGEAKMSQQGMVDRVEVYRRLASSLIYELREIEVIAKQQAERLSPAKIEQVAEQSMLETLGAACWRTYKKLAADYDAAAIERDIRQRIALHIEENLR